MSTGAAESINRALHEARAYLLISMLDTIQVLASDWFYRYRKAATSCDTYLTLTIKVTLRDRSTAAQKMIVKPLSMFEIKVIGGKLDVIVDLGQKCCSCRVFDIDILLCLHALAAVEDLESVYGLSSQCYTVDN